MRGRKKGQRRGWYKRWASDNTKTHNTTDWSKAFGQQQRGKPHHSDNDSTSNTTGWHGHIGQLPFTKGTAQDPIPPTRITLKDLQHPDGAPIDTDRGRTIRGRTSHPLVRQVKELEQSDFAQASNRWHRQVVFDIDGWIFEKHFSGRRYLWVERTDKFVRKSVEYASELQAEVAFKTKKIRWAETISLTTGK